MHRFAAEACSTAGLLFLSQCPWNDLVNPIFDDVGLAGFKSRAIAFFIDLSCSIPTIVFYYFSPFSSFCL